MTPWVWKLVRWVTEAVRVELNGKYSLRRVVALANHIQESSTWRVVAFVLLTPMPGLAVTLLLELIPLNPPTMDMEKNVGSATRSFLMTAIFCFILFAQFAHFLPTLPFSVRRNAVQSVVVASATIGASFGLVFQIGFPIPFSIITTSPIWMVFVILAMVVSWGRHVREQGEALRQPITNAILVWSRHNALVLVYPLYMFLYTMVPQRLKAVPLFLMPGIKVLLRAWYCNSLTHLSDELLELAIMTVDVYSALFTMYCMQITPSLLTTAGLMTIDFFQLVVSLHEVSLLLAEVVDIHEKVGSAKRGWEAASIGHQNCSYVDRAADVIKREYYKSKPQQQQQQQQQQRQHLSTRRVSRYSTLGRMRRLSALLTFAKPSTAPTANDVPNIPDRAHIIVRPAKVVPGDEPTIDKTGLLEQRYLDAVRRLLYLTEFLLLVHYVEFIIPFIFATYTAAVYHMSNRTFFSHLNSMTTEELHHTISNLYFYAALELLSLIVLHNVLWHKFNLPGVSQLAFVLENQWDGVQSRLIFWTLYNAQPALYHNGFPHESRKHPC